MFLSGPLVYKTLGKSTYKKIVTNGFHVSYLSRTGRNQQAFTTIFHRTTLFLVIEPLHPQKI